MLFRSHGLAMEVADLLFIQDYFKSIGRFPTETELSIAIVVDTIVKGHWFKTVRFDDASKVVGVGDKFIITLVRESIFWIPFIGLKNAPAFSVCSIVSILV